jgi:hypothetical protein
MVLAALIVLSCFNTAWAEEDLKAAMKSDKTGTNPINFTHDFRLYNEYQFLNTDSDGYQNISTVEFRAPFNDGKWQLRMRGRYQKIDIDPDGAFPGLDESGIGDFDFRFLTVPIVKMEKKFALATGFEFFLPTATEDALGSGAFSIGPQVFGVFFAPLGMKGFIFAPAYQHKFSIDEDEGRDEVHQGLIDLYVLWASADKQYWSLFDPQIVLDYENDVEFMIIDLEMGMMIDKFLNTKGHSVYLRPSVGIGTDRPTDGSVEFGYKIIW